MAAAAERGALPHVGDERSARRFALAPIESADGRLTSLGFASTECQYLLLTGVEIGYVQVEMCLAGGRSATSVGGGRGRDE